MIRAEDRLDGSALHILLNQPRANILSGAMIGAIGDALDSHVSADTRLIVFEGAGEHFSFGVSVEEHRTDQATQMLATFHGLFRKLADLAIPTCAVVRGQCLGGGLELASWCTWIVCTPDARLGQPEIRLGVFAPMASILLPWRAGGRAALDLCVSGRDVSAERARELGIVNAVTDEPTAWWEQIVHDHLDKTSASSLRFAEKAVRTHLLTQLDRELRTVERLYLDELNQTHDATEGIEAFLERRQPEFRNH